MKNLKNIILLCIIASLTIFTNCSDDDEPSVVTQVETEDSSNDTTDDTTDDATDDTTDDTTDETTGATNFVETFSYSADQVVEELEYEGIFAEWPQPDDNYTVSGGTVSIEDGKLKWVWTQVLEAAIGFEFDEPLDLTANSTLKFSYQFPAGTIFSVYLMGEEGEGQLFAGTDFIMTMGADGMSEVEIDLSKSSSLADADPNTVDMSKFSGFYLIAGLTDETGALLPDAEGSVLYFDNIRLGGQ
tara:strand:- start:51 stop:782 length:732 start_codon:yes stop_codon:yes gene_type:complete